MDSLYAEVVVKPKQPVVRNVMVGLIYLFAVAVFLTACRQSIANSTIAILMCSIPFLAVVVALNTYFYRRGKIEYEYLYCDDVMIVAKIINKSKRKNMAKIETDNIELFAPVEAGELNAYKDLPKRDFASMKKRNPVYAMVTVLQGKKVRILLEPSEKMLGCLKIKLGTRMIQKNGVTK